GEKGTRKKRKVIYLLLEYAAGHRRVAAMSYVVKLVDVSLVWSLLFDRIHPFILRSEDHLSRKPKGALAGEVAGFAGELGSAGGRCYSAEVGIGDIRVRVAEIRRVGHGKRIYSELETHPFRDPEVSQEPRVQIKEARSAKNVATGSTIAHLAGRDLSERTRREILASWIRKGTIHEITGRILMLDMP